MTDGASVADSSGNRRFRLKSDPRTVVVAIAFCAVFILAIAGLKLLGFWQNHLYAVGLYPIGYNALRATLFLYAISVCVSIGGLVLGLKGIDDEPSDTGDPELETTIVSAYTGAAVFCFIGCLLGLIGALTLPWVVILLLPAVFYTGLQLRRLGRLFGNLAVGLTGDFAPALGLLALLAVGVLVFVTRGLQPDTILVDTFGHYIPFYDDALSRGKADTQTYFLTYFFGRGAGLQFLFATLSDVNFFHLVSFFYHFLACLVVLHLTSGMFAPKSALPFVLAITYLVAATSVASEFSKIHLSGGSVIVGLLYLGVLLQRTDNADTARTKRALLIISGGLAVMSPTSVLFGGALIAFALVIALGRRDKSAAVGFFASGALMGMIVVAGLLYNYLSSGMAEITPFSLATKMSDPTRRPAALLLWETWYVGTQEGGAVAFWRTLIDKPPLTAATMLADALWRKFGEGVMPAAVPAAAGLVVLLGLIGARLLGRRRHAAFFDAGTLVVVFALFVLLLTFVLQLVIVQGSLERTLTFLDAMRVLVIGAALAQLVDYIARATGARDKPSAMLPAKISNIVAMAMALQAILLVVSLYRSGLLRSPAFAFGAASYAEYIGLGTSPDTDACVLGRRAAATTDPILLLHFIPSCYGHPMARMERPDMNSFNDFQDKVYTGDAETAKAILRSRNVNYFLFAPGYPMHIFAFAPVFQPESLEKNFGISKIIGNNILLLTWKDKAAMDIPSQYLKAAQPMFDAAARSQEHAAYEQYRALVARP